jgi:translation initiation factor IF-2
MSNNDEQIRIDLWAKQQGVPNEIVLRFLRESGVDARTQVSKVAAGQLASITDKVLDEKAKIEARKAKKPGGIVQGSAAVKPGATRADALANAGETVSARQVKGKSGLVKAVIRRSADHVDETPAPVALHRSTDPKPVRQEEPIVEAVKPVVVAPAPERSGASAPATVAPAESPRTEPSGPISAEPPKEVPAPLESAVALKSVAFKAQVTKPDAAILARIEKSKQQAALQRSGGGRPPQRGNGPGYTGSFGRAPVGQTGAPGTQNRGPGGPGGGPGGGGGYNRGPGGPGGGPGGAPRGPRTGGFSSGSMQDAFSTANHPRAAGGPGGFSAPGAASAPAKPNTQRGGGGKKPGGNRGKPGGNKPEKTRESFEAARQNVSRVMASLSKHPVKKTYHKEHGAEEGGEDRKILKTSDFITVGELAGLMEQMPARVIAKCMEMGMMVTINARLDFETIQVLADEFGFEAQLMEEYEENVLGVEEEAAEDLQARHPVVTVMGHVDHGKTSLLDWIRHANVVAGESGGITQHIGAYEVTTPVGKVTFLDTPGHEAFTAMRARGSQVTDVIVLVVAADSMVMPQTVESIELARSSKVPIVVAITKIDLPTANPDKIRTQLAERGVEVEQWGGQVSCVEVSARTGVGMERLIEILALETDVLELKANPEARARGAVVESKLDAGKGSMATVLIQNGTLHVGDVFVCGNYAGRVRAMFDERGQAKKEAGPSAPCQVLGFDGTPQAGDDLVVVEDEKTAREIASNRRMAARERELRFRKHMSLEQVYDRAKSGEFSELNLIVKADVDGSCEAIAASLLKLSNKEVKINIVRKAVGAVNDSDILLASASDAIIVAFHLMPSLSIREMAEKEGVEIKTYRIIYEIIEDIEGVIEGKLKPTIREEMVAEAEIREVFKIPKIGLIAGCMVREGEITRDAQVRVYRNGVELGLTKVQSLKRVKDDVSTVKAGLECGIGLKGYENILEGDSLIFFKQISVARTLADVAKDAREEENK